MEPMEELKEQRLKAILKRGKVQLNNKIKESRIKYSSNLIQLHEVVEVKEVNTVKHEKGYLLLNQHQKSH